MTTPVPGSHIVCTTCAGEGAIREVKRATMRAYPEVSALGTFRGCTPCEGTGWLPPLHRPADTDDSEETGE